MKTSRRAFVSLCAALTVTFLTAALFFLTGPGDFSGGLRFYNPFLIGRRQTELEDAALLAAAFLDSPGGGAGESIRALGERLGAAPEEILLVEDPPGLLLGCPPSLRAEAAAFWRGLAARRGRGFPAGLTPPPGFAAFLPVFELGGLNRMLFYTKTRRNMVVGRLEPEEAFKLPVFTGFAFFPLLFISLWLTVFLLFGPGRDPLKVIRRRAMLLQVQLQKKLSVEGERFSAGRLERRREALRREFRRGLGRGTALRSTALRGTALRGSALRDGQGGEAEVNRRIEQALDDILEAVRAGAPAEFEPSPPEPEFFENPDEESRLDFPAPEILKDSQEKLEFIDEDVLGYTPGPSSDEAAILKVEDPVSDISKEESPLGGEEPEELLEELEEYEELEALEEAEAEPAAASGAGPDFGTLASEIEFAPVVEIDESDPLMAADMAGLEIVDPFAEMLSDLSAQDGDADSKKKTSFPGSLTASLSGAPGTGTAELRSGGALVPAVGSFYAYYPGGTVALLEAGPAAPEDGVILELNGLHSINTRYFSPDRATLDSLDGEFRKLVTSVLRQGAAARPL
jgi:hypothetical protein